MENEHDGHDHGQYDIPQPKEPIKAATAFLIVCMPDGIKAAYSDVNTPLELEREATLNDMFEGACQVQRDVTIMQMTNHVVSNTVNGLMMAMQQQMMAAQNQQLASQVMGPPNRQQRRHG